VVFAMCYVGNTLAAREPLYSCCPRQIIHGVIIHPGLLPHRSPTFCGLDELAGAPWWVEAAGTSATLAGGSETVLALKRRRGQLVTQVHRRRFAS